MDVFDEPTGEPDWVRIRTALRRVVVTLDPEALASKASLNASRQKLQSMDTLSDTGEGRVLTLPLVLARTLIGVVAVGPDGRQALTSPAVDEPLYIALVRAEAWKHRLLTGEAATFDTLAKDEGVTPAFVRRLIRIAYLAPA